jgi:hypothetical protein
MHFSISIYAIIDSCKGSFTYASLSLTSLAKTVETAASEALASTLTWQQEQIGLF